MYDALVDEGGLAFCKASCEFVNVGKRAGAHSWGAGGDQSVFGDGGEPREYVVRLKGGDPFVFGRGGGRRRWHWPRAALGLRSCRAWSSAVAAAGAAMIPVTHRGVATHFTVMTGSSARDLEGLSDKWEHLAKASGTLVFLMPVAQLEVICDRLQAQVYRALALLRWSKGTTGGAARVGGRSSISTREPWPWA